MTYKLYIQTEQGCAVLDEFELVTVDTNGLLTELCDCISSCTDDMVADLVDPGTFFFIGCGVEVPDFEPRGKKIYPAKQFMIGNRPRKSVEEQLKKSKELRARLETKYAKQRRIQTTADDRGVVPLPRTAPDSRRE